MNEAAGKTITLRARMERAIETMIAALDRIDGDPDFEPDCDLEDDELDDDRDALGGLCDWPEPEDGAGSEQYLYFDREGQAMANNMLRRFGRAA